MFRLVAFSALVALALAAPKEMRLSPKEMHLSPKEMHLSPKEMHLSPKEMHLSPKEMKLSPKEMHLSPKEMQLSPREMTFNNREFHIAERQKVIDHINNLPGVSWQAGHVAHFSGKPIGASKSLCGVKNMSEAPAQLRSDIDNGVIGFTAGDAPVKGWTDGADIPANFDSATNWAECEKVINDIRDQSNCGCCWAFGTAEAASDRMCIATKAKIMLPLSAEELCFCSNSNGCDGGFPLSAWQFIGKQGLVTGGQQGDGPFDALGLCSDFSLPHCHHHGPQGKDPYPAEGAAGCASQTSPECPRKCDAKAAAPHNEFASDKYSYTGGATMYGYNETRLQMEIMTRGPVTAAFTVYSDFENYVGGIYHHVSGGALGGHAVKIVGWGVDAGVDYWKVANSWNPFWGEKGYFRIKRGNNECGIAGSCAASNDDAKWSAPQ